jgi:putative hemolysin
MNGQWLQVGVIAVLLLANAAFAGSEIAFISLREGQLRRLERQSRTGRVLVQLARDPNRFLATIQVGITLAGFLASATAALALAEPLIPYLDVFGAAARPVAVVAVTLVLTYVTLVVGELAPKRLAMQHAERWALLAARPLHVMATVAGPLVWLLGRATNAVVRLFGTDPTIMREEITPAEIGDLVRAHRGFTPEQQLIISGAIGIAERRLRQVLVPRTAVFTLDADTPVPVARGQLAASGHSRAPVVRHRDLDQTVGVVNLRDLVAADGAALADVARPPVLLPESLFAIEALRRFKVDRQQFALVVDEYGGAKGIVTLEDLVEEVVGEIYDETDREVEAVRREGDGSILLPGTFPVRELPEVGVELGELPRGDYATVAGLVIVLLGHLPTGPGETVALDGWTAEITEVDRRAVTGVRLRIRGNRPNATAPG